MTPLPLSHRGHREAPLALRQSLRVRLPLVISALIVAGAVTLLWAAFHEVESTLVRAGGERAASAGTRVATLIERSSHSGMDNLHRAAASAELREYLRNPTDATREQARTRLAPLAVTGPRRVEVWTAGGTRVLDIWVPGRSVAAASPERLPAATGAPAIGYSALQAADGVIFVDSAAEIAGGGPPPAGLAAGAAALGTLAVRSTLSINPPGVLSRLVGDDAVVEIGNAEGATWTDIRSGGINSLWPLFGIANQLLAAIALCVATTILVKMHGKRYMWITCLPLSWLVAVSFTAAYYKILSPLPRVGFLAQADQLRSALNAGTVPAARIAETQALIFNARLDAVLCGVFVLLVALILVDSIRQWVGILRGTRPATLAESPFVPTRLQAEEI